MLDRRDHDRAIPWIARLLLDTGPAGVALLEGPEFSFTYANRAYEALAGPRAVLGRPYAQVWPEHAVDVLPLLERARSTGRVVEEHERRIELQRVPGAAPEVAWMTFFFQPLPGRAGEPASIAIHVIDRTGEVEARRREAELSSERTKLLQATLVTRATQTAQRLAEAAAEEARRKAAELDTVLESIADGLVLYDPEGRVLRMNAAAVRMLGFTEEERRLTAVERLEAFTISGARGERLAANDLPTARALAGEVVSGVEVRFARNDGSRPPFWASMAAAPIRGDDGALHGAVTTLTDITRLRNLQDQREDLMRAISHDLRTPLTVIHAQAQLLARRPDDREVVLRRAATLRTSAQRMSEMIEDLVEAVRLEAGKLRIAPRPVALGPFALELRERLRGAYAIERLRLDLPDALPPALADPPRLERILVNLVTNALKYSPAGEEVLLGAAESGRGVRITVRDRGAGIAAEELPRIFERFYRTPGAGQTEGLGLGLYITRLLVEAHGGRLTAESVLGAGSAFHVDLPLAE